MGHMGKISTLILRSKEEVLTLPVTTHWLCALTKAQLKRSFRIFFNYENTIVLRPHKPGGFILTHISFPFKSLNSGKTVVSNTKPISISLANKSHKILQPVQSICMKNQHCISMSATEETASVHVAKSFNFSEKLKKQDFGEHVSVFVSDSSAVFWRDRFTFGYQRSHEHKTSPPENVEYTFSSRNKKMCRAFQSHSPSQTSDFRG